MANPVGRPTLYTPELGQKICQVIATDGRSIPELSKAFDFFPVESAFYNWVNKHPEFEELLSRARRAQAEIRLEQAQTWINDASQDYREDSKGRLVANNVYATRLRAHIQFNQWRAAKLLQEKYGEKQLEDKVQQTERDVELIKTVLQANRDKLDK